MTCASRARSNSGSANRGGSLSAPMIASGASVYIRESNCFAAGTRTRSTGGFPGIIVALAAGASTAIGSCHCSRWRPLARTRSHPRAALIVRLSSWRATLNLHWQPFEAFGVKAQIGRIFDTTLRYQLRDGSQTRVDPSDATFFGLVLSARI